MITNFILALLCSTTTLLTPSTVENNSDYKSDISCNMETLNVASNEVTIDDYENFSLDKDFVENSAHVLSQKEIIEIPEITYEAPNGYYFSDNGEIAQFSDSVYKSDIYTEPGGYVTLTTTAYQIGLYDGNVVYRITSHAELNKSFFFTQKDNLIIRTGDNAVFYDGIECKGTSSIYDIKNGHNFLEEYELTPVFSKGPGVLYEFGVVQSTGPGDSYNPRQTIVDGDYYLVATNTTSVQSVYVHNQKLFTDSLSFSYGPIGINIPLGWAEAAIYYATPLTLEGYDDVITRQIHTIKQADYGFEQQYFFYSKTASHEIDGLSFTTKRLRCGYIEQEYINLSAQRQNAGKAYLEFAFTKPVFQVSTQLAFWSANEQFKEGDTAYVQYLDENNNWITLLDMLNAEDPLPTDRTAPKRYNFHIIQGTTGIRFYSHINNPTADRNKGRICIGETKFTTYNI